MGDLIYSAIASLDGYVTDEDGSFDWAEPDEQVHSFINDLERPIGLYLYGRRMYETMAVWETGFGGADLPPHIEDFAQIWRAAEKIVYSTTLELPSTARTRIERRFDPAAVRQLKATAASGIAIGGADLGGQAIRAGLVDEYHLLLAPIVVGGGKRSLPDGVKMDLELVETRRFDSGFVYCRYRSAD